MHTRLTDMDYLIRANTEVTTFFSELHRNYVLRLKSIDRHRRKRA